MSIAQTATIRDIRDIIKANKEAGRYFFSRDTMKFFGSSVYPELYKGELGIVFITSEDQFDRSLPKQYHVRVFNPENGHVETLPGTRFFPGFGSKAEAQRAAAQIAMRL